MRPGEPFYNNKVESTNTTWLSFNVDFFFPITTIKKIYFGSKIFFHILLLNFHP